MPSTRTHFSFAALTPNAPVTAGVRHLGVFTMAVTKNDPSYRLRAFRVAAKQVRDTGPIDRGARISFHASKQPDVPFEEHAHLLEPDGFRSLAMAVRQVYLQKSAANFNRVCQTLKHQSTTEHTLVDHIQEQYHWVLDGSGILFQGPVNGKLKSYTARQVFNTWMNTRGFHFDPSIESDHQVLSDVGHYFLFILQAIVLHLAGCVLALDDLVADALGEARLPRIAHGDAAPCPEDMRSGAGSREERKEQNP